MTTRNYRRNNRQFNFFSNESEEFGTDETDDTGTDETDDEIEKLPASNRRSRAIRSRNSHPGIIHQGFIKMLKKETKKLRSNNWLYRKTREHNHILMFDTLGVLYDDILYRHWLQFTEALKSYPQAIHRFEIVNIQMPPNVLKILIPALEGKNLERLRLQQNRFGKNYDNDQSCDVFGNCILILKTILKVHLSLKSLCVIDNAFHSNVDAANQLSHEIYNHPSLEQISINRCCNDDGGESNNEIFSAILYGSRNVRHVTLSNNEIDMRTMFVLISRVLEENPLMEVLDVCDDNKYNVNDDKNGDDEETTAALSYLIRALKENSNLKQLTLISSNISLRTKKSLLKAIFDNSSLNSVVDSNHTCVLIVDRLRFYHCTSRDELKNNDDEDECYTKLLMMNKSYSESETKNNKIFIALRHQCIRRYNRLDRGVDDGKLKLHFFNDVPLILIPRVFEFLQEKDPRKDKMSLSSVFELLSSKAPILLF